MTRPLCIYHGGCQDGFTAAWVVWKALNGECDFHPGVYQDPPPDVTDRVVYMVDFSYKAPVVAEMAKIASIIYILDHHKSAIGDLEAAGAQGTGLLNPDKVMWALDTERSGAGITWDYFFSAEERPTLVSYVEDRDLFKFQYPESNAFSARLFAEEYSFERWDDIAQWQVNGVCGDLMRSFIKEGQVILAYNTKSVKELVAENGRVMNIGGVFVPVCCLPKTYTTEAGHLMAAGAPFAACYWDTPAGRVFSLRSREQGGLDVQVIAVKYGGGGHEHAAGFRVPYDQLAEKGLL